MPNGRGLWDQFGTRGLSAAVGEVAAEGGAGQVDRPAVGVQVPLSSGALPSVKCSFRSRAAVAMRVRAEVTVPERTGGGIRLAMYRSMLRDHRSEAMRRASLLGAAARQSSWVVRESRRSESVRVVPSTVNDQKVHPSTRSSPAAIRAADVGVFQGRWKHMILPSASRVALAGPRFPRPVNAIPPAENASGGRAATRVLRSTRWLATAAAGGSDPPLVPSATPPLAPPSEGESSPERSWARQPSM
ncbi:hypothetical protein BLA24_33155 [Streptomyces cinnamoneus]|uniref:Uncharacterized protein n=1 Tax=Streptomyces cinnamoneus TaxID=53446 RepID=A0A2G1XAQ6_STRCJ|nr:hypothetical protein BLA24_33155 [Streptomyces cinnamoneus]PPT15890.1 hypothetical protein CYQ11_26205 [Streptomyces cinnamoneus]